MTWRLDTDVQQMLRESAQAFLADTGGPQHFRAVRAGDAGFDPATWAQMGELGWTGILLPEAVGGAELGLAPALTLAEELGRAISPEPFVAASVIAATVLASASGEAAGALAQDLASGRRSVALAWQEETGALGADGFETTLAEGRLSGRKVHVPAWHDASALLVAAQAADGPVVVLVDPAAEGVAVSPTRMTDATQSAEIRFDGVRVADASVILSGEAARSAIDFALARGTVALCAQLEGLANALWRRTADYVQQRVQFDQPLADFQALRHRMVDLYAAIELAGASWRAAARSLEDGGGANRLAVHAAKARCSDTALEMSRWAIQYHGAFGYTDEADVGLFVHAALRWASWLGNATAHRRAALALHERGEGIG